MKLVFSFAHRVGSGAKRAETSFGSFGGTIRRLWPASRWAGIARPYDWVALRERYGWSAGESYRTRGCYAPMGRTSLSRYNVYYI